MTRIYLDMCCLKRPFDDQSQARNHLESEAVLTLLAAPAEQAQFLHAGVHGVENDQNPVATRAARVRSWLAHAKATTLEEAALATRTAELIATGFRNFVALHLASAELAGANVFCTCDDWFLALATRVATTLRV